MKLGQTFAVGLFVFVMAVTPLSAFTSGGSFETWLPGWDYGTASRPRTRVVLLDQTGLVRAISPVDFGALTSPSALVVRWYGCGHSTLTFESREGGLLISDRDLPSCFFGDGRSIAIHLWSPVDPSTLEVDLPH